MLQKFFSDSFIYAIPNLLSRSVGFVLLIFYTRFLSPENYGIIELILVLFSLLNLILPLEITQGVARFFSDSDQAKRNKIVSTSFIFTLVIFILPIFLSLVFPDEISNFFFSTSLEKKGIVLIFCFMLFHSLQKLFENQLRWSLEPKKYSFLSILGSLSFSLFPVYFIYFLELGLMGYIYGVALASFVSFGYGFYLVNSTNKINLFLNKKTLAELLSFSSPLVLSSAAFYVFSYSDRWMLQLFESSGSVGIYGASSRLASLAAIMHVLSRYAFMPLVYSSYKDPKSNEEIGKIFTFISLMGIFFLTFILIFSNDLVSLILGKDYSEASNLLGFLSASIILMNTYFFSPGLNIAKRTKFIAGISILVAIINLIGNYFLIPLFSMQGAAISSLIASFVMVLLYFYFGQKEYKIPIPHLKIFMFITFNLLIVIIQKILFFDDIFFKLIGFGLTTLLFLIFIKDSLMIIKELFYSDKG